MSIRGGTVRALAIGSMLAVSSVAIISEAVGAPPDSRQDRPLPPPVEVRPEPEGVTLADPSFEPLPGAQADFGRLGGAVYQIEMPDDWNGRLVLFMHGFEDFRSEAGIGPPDTRRYLIGRGYAWAASSFSSTSQIPGRAADETAALWDFFARKYRRPTRSYVTGFSMGGTATHIAAERYPDRFDGALALCGAAGLSPGLAGTADYFAAAAYVAGVTQAEFDATTDIEGLIRDRILPALRDPAKQQRFVSIMLDLTGGPRPFGRDGFRIEETTNWRRTALAVSAQLAPNRNTTYRLGPISAVKSREFNRSVVRLPLNEDVHRAFVEGADATGLLRLPMLTLHTTGDGQVPIEQARILERRVDAAGKGNLLVQRIIRDPGHCGFRNPEIEAAFAALVRWVEHGVKPQGNNVMAQDLRAPQPSFELAPRSVSGSSVPGARDRVQVRGHLTLDGAPFDAQYLGAVVRRAGLITPCQGALPPVNRGNYRISVLAVAEASGCGEPGADVLLWAFVSDQILFSHESVAWPEGARTADFDATFSLSEPDGAVGPITGFAGEVFDRLGRQKPPGTVVEAFVGETRCGVASTRRSGSFSGFSMDVVGPSSVPGCDLAATLSFRIDGKPAAETAVNGLGDGSSLDLSLP